MEKVKASDLSEMMLAEEQMAQKETTWIDDVISQLGPEHPLAVEVNNLRMSVGNNLSLLPEKHPVLTNLRKARVAIERKNNHREKNAEVEAAQERKAEDNIKMADQINSKVDHTVASLVELTSEIEAINDNSDSAYVRKSTERLSRLCRASARGMDEARISISRLRQGY